MEGKGEGGGGGGGGGAGAGEVRKVHIIYFLSRMGRIEHPHLIRVQHLSRNGIHLRDVKRWLSELRGKNMPDSFSWSYKRRYKSGFVWQDLMDDDLITPISDNEFVLKGSEILVPFDICTCRKKTQDEGKSTEEDAKVETDKSLSSSDISSTKTSQTEDDSGPLDSDTSASTEESFKTSAVFTPESSTYLKTNTETEIEELEEEVMEKCFLSKEEEVEIGKETAKKFSKKKSKTYSSGSSNVFRNLLNCSNAVDTNDAAVTMMKKNGPNFDYSPLNDSAAICRLDAFGGSERIFSAASWNQQQAQYARNSFSGGRSSIKSNEFGNPRKISAAYKPVREPHCSQCGKTFNPEKFYTHMKSCRGLKSYGKNRATTTASNESMSPADELKETWLKKQTQVAH